MMLHGLFTLSTLLCFLMALVIAAPICYVKANEILEGRNRLVNLLTKR